MFCSTEGVLRPPVWCWMNGAQESQSRVSGVQQSYSVSRAEQWQWLLLARDVYLQKQDERGDSCLEKEQPMEVTRMHTKFEGIGR